jgi:hypothetical protein
MLDRRVGILESRLNESDSELKHLCGEIEIARKAEADLHSALTEIHGRADAATQGCGPRSTAPTASGYGLLMTSSISSGRPIVRSCEIAGTAPSALC